LLVDARRPPLDKACGEGLMPDGRARLEALGVTIPAQRPFSGITYLEGQRQIVGRFPPGVVGAGIRRTALHQALVDRVAACGLEIRWGTRIFGLIPSGVRTPADEIAAHFVIGADGLRSRVRSWAGLEGRPAPSQRFGGQRFGVRKHFRVAPWSDQVEVYWSEKAEAYVTPIADDEVGVAILWREAKASFATLLKRFPTLQVRLAGALFSSSDRGAGPFRQNVRAVVRERVALVGDAAGYVDAITGEGLSLAFHQAAALAKAVEAQDLKMYQRAHRDIGRVPNALTELTLFLERHPRLRRRAFAALAAEPAIFERFLAIHCRAAAPFETVLPVAPRLLWRLLVG
jgi:menaquinone-9 beta-reductase